MFVISTYPVCWDLFRIGGGIFGIWKSISYEHSSLNPYSTIFPHQPQECVDVV